MPVDSQVRFSLMVRCSQFLSLISVLLCVIGRSIVQQLMWQIQNALSADWLKISVVERLLVPIEYILILILKNALSFDRLAGSLCLASVVLRKVICTVVVLAQEICFCFLAGSDKWNIMRADGVLFLVHRISMSFMHGCRSNRSIR